MALKGCISYFETCTLTQEELYTCKWVSLTNEFRWEPHSDQFQENEENILNQTFNDYPKDREIFTCQRKYNTSHHWIHNNMLSDISHSLNETDILQQLYILSTTASLRGVSITLEVLAKGGVLD